MIKLDFKPNYENKACNYCGRLSFKVLSKKDRYGLLVVTVICKNCGLIFINPRMDKDSYVKFYQGVYRKLLQDHKNKPGITWNVEKNFLAAEKLGIKLASVLKGYINKGSLIEVGSSLGGILSGFKRTINELDVSGIEPAKEEADFANSKGIKTHVGLIEDNNDNIRNVDNIVIVRSLNHVLDPKMFFEWTHKRLRLGGKIIVVVINFLSFCERKGKVVTQIDHPFMFSEYSLKQFVESAGFDIVFEDYVTRPDYLMVVANKTDKTPFTNIKVNDLAYLNSLKKLNWKNLFLSRIKNRFNL